MLFRPRKNGFGVFLCALYELTGTHDCSTGRIEESDIHEITLALIRQQAVLAEEASSRRKENKKTVMLTADGIRTEIQNLRKLSEKAKTSKMTLWERYHGGSISKEAFQIESEKISAQTAKYTDEIAALETRLKDLEISTGEENLIEERYIKQTGITELTQSVVDEFIKEVIVYAPDRIEIVLNYADQYLKLAENTEAAVSAL
jgi:hypothetical protein